MAADDSNNTAMGVPNSPVLAEHPHESAIEAEKDSQAIHLRFEFALEGAPSRRVRVDVAEVRLKLTLLYGHVAPANHAIAPQQRQRVVPQLPLRRRRVRLE